MDVSPCFMIVFLPFSSRRGNSGARLSKAHRVGPLDLSVSNASLQISPSVHERNAFNVGTDFNGVYPVYPIGGSAGHRPQTRLRESAFLFLLLDRSHVGFLSNAIREFLLPLATSIRPGDRRNVFPPVSGRRMACLLRLLQTASGSPGAGPYGSVRVCVFRSPRCRLLVFVRKRFDRKFRSFSDAIYLSLLVYRVFESSDFG